MDKKKILEVAQGAMDAFSAEYKTKKVKLKVSDIEKRLYNPSPHDDFIDLKATFNERVGMKIFCHIVDLCKLI